MKLGLYPKIAADGIRKNGRLYVPYIVTSILMIAVFYIMHLLGYSDIMKGFSGSGTAREMLQFGSLIMAVFGTIFLFYTQSTLIKGRFKEFGIYSVLGMNKRNLIKVIFFETVMTWAISMAGGILAGIGLSKIAELGFEKMIEADINYGFIISGESLGKTILVYSIIFGLIFLNAARQILFSRTINLVNSDKAGEKPPKANWAVGILGLVFLLAGYTISLKIESPMAALLFFFVAVILIIIGTYLILIAGSVVLCRILQKNKSYYYKTNHFVSVSSMAYRMKRNGAGLASICILLTMILVTISSTAALYFNREETLRNHYPNQINLLAHNDGLFEGYKDAAARLENDVNKVAEESGTKVINAKALSHYSLSGYYDNNGAVDLELDPYATLSMTLDYDRIVVVNFYDVDDYNRMTNKNITVPSGKALLGIDGNIQIGDEVRIGKKKFEVEKIDLNDGNFKSCIGSSPVSVLAFIVDDLNSAVADFEDIKDTRNESLLIWTWNYYFDTELNAQGQIDLSKKINAEVYVDVGEERGIEPYCTSRENERADFVSTFGGLFFLGILLSSIFMVSCVLIIYYKQISEGFEDQSRFSIMQKVGMTKENIKKSINSQMLTVFLIPILFACLHLAVVLPVVHKLLLLFGHNNIPLLLASAGLCVLFFGLIYAFVYKLTSNAYYKIVS
ncbi:MAG: ABC transporter permease [Clostridiales bacterium]|nr:ABC transporter permease [Clostridiales bacterium]